jgi:hypothetical protein
MADLLQDIREGEARGCRQHGVGEERVHDLLHRRDGGDAGHPQQDLEIRKIRGTRLVALITGSRLVPISAL